MCNMDPEASIAAISDGSDSESKETVELVLSKWLGFNSRIVIHF